MNELEDRALSSELSIIFHFTDGERYTQTLPIDHADAAQDVMDWFKDKKGSPVWTWLDPYYQRVKMIPRTKVVFIEIVGYISPDGHDSRWYQRLFDKYRVWRMTK